MPYPGFVYIENCVCPNCLDYLNASRVEPATAITQTSTALEEERFNALRLKALLRALKDTTIVAKARCVKCWGIRVLKKRDGKVSKHAKGTWTKDVCEGSGNYPSKYTEMIYKKGSYSGELFKFEIGEPFIEESHKNIEFNIHTRVIDMS